MYTDTFKDKTHTFQLQFPVLQHINEHLHQRRFLLYSHTTSRFFFIRAVNTRESRTHSSFRPSPDQNETFHPTKIKIPRREEFRCGVGTDSTKEFAAEGVSPREGVNDEKRGREKMRLSHVTRQVVALGRS